MKKEKTLEASEKRKRIRIANKLWSIPYVIGNLDVFSKKDLVFILENVFNKISECMNLDSSVDFKEALFLKKCFLIEAIYPNFIITKKGEKI